MKPRLTYYLIDVLENNDRVISKTLGQHSGHKIAEMSDKQSAKLLFDGLKEDLSIQQFDAFVEHFKNEIIIKDY